MLGRTSFAATALCVFWLLALCGCSPELNWREVRPEGSGVVALFPCKPSVAARAVTLAGARVQMSLATCRAEHNTYALAYADAGEPARAGPALAALRSAASANLGSPALLLGPMRVPGMTPNPLAERLSISGTLPNGETVTQVSAVFTRGTWVYQASMTGTRLSAESIATFFDSFKLPT